jgi:hypothetical protein
VERRTRRNVGASDNRLDTRMRTTAKGVPYAEATDLRRDWPSTSSQIATWVNDHTPRGIATGTWAPTGNVPAASGINTAAQTFPAGRFTTTPVLTAMVISTGYLIATVATVSSTGFMLRLWNPHGTTAVNAGSYSIIWQAVEL